MTNYDVQLFPTIWLLGSRTIPSGLNLNAWEKYLKGYHDESICMYLRYGWPSSYTRDVPAQMLHITQCVHHSCRFMACILATLRRAPSRGTIILDDDFRKDISWFLRFAKDSNGTRIIPEVVPSFNIEADSYMDAGGGHSSDHYYSCIGLYDDHIISLSTTLHILDLRLLT